MLLLLLAATTSLRAQDLADYDYENLTFRGIGLDYGYIWPTRVAATPTYSMRLDLGFLGPGVRIAPSITYWSSHFRNTELARLAGQINNLPALRDRNVTVSGADFGEIRWSDLSLGLDAHLLFTTPVGVFTYLGAGAAVHALNGQGDFIESTFVEDLLDSTSAGIAVMAGAELQLGPRLRVYGEARYNIVSDVRYPGVRLGGAFMLPPRAPSQSTR